MSIAIFGGIIPGRFRLPFSLAFKAAIAARFRQRAGCSMGQSIRLAKAIYEAFLHDEGIRFGHPDYEWTVWGAFDLADEEMGYWDD